MRRLASVLVASKRSDKSDAPASSPAPSPSPDVRLAHKKSRVFPSLSRKHLPPSDPPSLPPLFATDLANSSSSSSSGSTTLRTPDDDGLPRTSSKKGSWKSWLGGKNAVVGDPSEEHHAPHRQSSLSPPKPGSNEADDASSQFDDPYANTDDIPTPSHSIQLALAVTACANARIMIMNSLVHDTTSPPLFQSSDAGSFPRSQHDLRHLRRRETLESEMHKKSLLARLDHLSPSAELSIVPLASKQIAPRRQIYRSFQEDVFPSPDAVSIHSTGLTNWVSRPCFEDRLQLWTRSGSGDIVRTRVPGSNLGVAALEFSDAVEILAGTLLEDEGDLENLETSDPPATRLKGEETGSLSSQSKDSSTKGSPPQLNTAPPDVPKAPSPEQQPDELTTSGSAVSNGLVLKRGVRFADDDGKDDQIPLGYVLRIRKNKEQKAQFLREERERREQAAQLFKENRRASVSPPENRVSRVVVRQRPTRPLISLSEQSTNEPSKPRQQAPASVKVSEEARIRQEFEKIEMEKLRRSREQSRKQAEEWERSFNEDLLAARGRFEASRVGRPRESALLSSRAGGNRSVSRDSVHVSFGRSGIPHKPTPELVFSPISPLDGSPSSSMPATPGSQYSLSRPPSLYSTHTASSEDVRGRDGKRASRRMSVVSDSAKTATLHPPYNHRASFSPYAWSNIPPVPVIPPMPPMPVTPMVNGFPLYGMDMPLLPPTPPFMMNQFGVRSHSYTGLGAQPQQTLNLLPKNYSSEGINTRSRNSSPQSSGSHQRCSSDEATRVTKTLGDPRGRDKRASVMTNAPPQSRPQRSSWVPSEHHSAKRSSTFRPASGVYSSGVPAPMRRRTAA